MLGIAGTTRGDDRNGNTVAHRVDQLQIKSQLGPVPVDTIQQDFSCTQLFADLSQGDRVQVPAFSATLDGALVPAVLLAVGARDGRLDHLVPDRIR